MSKQDWRIRPFAPGDAPAFAALNRQWIEELFGIEEKDIRQLEHPKAAILDKGGFIAVADAGGWVIGTGAILPAEHPPEDGRKWLEIIKMATEPSAQGRGVGTAILNRLIEFAREQQADAIWLETNAKLEAATALYEKHGFRKLEGDDVWPSPYDRCNLQMTLKL